MGMGMPYIISYYVERRYNLPQEFIDHLDENFSLLNFSNKIRYNCDPKAEETFRVAIEYKEARIWPHKWPRALQY